jgi:hypothetical protein
MCEVGNAVIAEKRIGSQFFFPETCPLKTATGAHPSTLSSGALMSFEIQDSNLGVVIVRIAGELTKLDMVQIQAAARAAIKKQGKIRVLVKVEDFLGWEKHPDWGDVTFIQHDGADIERMAIVGDEAWRDLAYAFTARGFRATEIEYFVPADHDQALAWLAAKKQ